MPVTRLDIERCFSVGDEIASGGGRRSFRLTAILDDRVRIQPTVSRTPSRLRFDKLSVVVDHFDSIDSSKIEFSVGQTLADHGLVDTQNESYLYGMAREYLFRQAPQSAEVIAEQFERDIDCARKMSPIERKRQMAKWGGKAKKIAVLSSTYLRNPYVVVDVLARADGVCEGCHSKAPFLRSKDQSPYLEVHHIVQLAHGGEDTVENAMALCPNCHREKHYGVAK
jgi:5-methylcytosine-specific restriction protein A